MTKMFPNDYVLGQIRQGRTRIHILEPNGQNPIFDGIITEVRFSDKERIQIQPTIANINYVVTFGRAITPLVIRAKGTISQCGNEIINYKRAHDFFENYSIRATLSSSNPTIKPLNIVIPQIDNKGPGGGGKVDNFTLEAYLIAFNISQMDPNFPVFDVTLEFVRNL